MDGKGVKFCLRKIQQRNCNTFFVFLFSVDNVGHVPTQEQLFSGRVSKELSQIEVMRDEDLGLLVKVKTSKSPCPDGIP